MLKFEKLKYSNLIFFLHLLLNGCKCVHSDNNLYFSKGWCTRVKFNYRLYLTVEMTATVPIKNLVNVSCDACSKERYVEITMERFFYVFLFKS